MKKNFKQTSRRGAIAWLLQRISAAIVFVLLMLHFVTYHFLSRGKAPAYGDVMAKVTSWWFPLLQLVFVTCALYHGLNGVWNIVEDYVSSRFWRLVCYGLILAVGLALFCLGTLTIVRIAYLKA